MCGLASWNIEKVGDHDCRLDQLYQETWTNSIYEGCSELQNRWGRCRVLYTENLFNIYWRKNRHTPSEAYKFIGKVRKGNQPRHWLSRNRSLVHTACSAGWSIIHWSEEACEVNKPSEKIPGHLNLGIILAWRVHHQRLALFPSWPQCRQRFLLWKRQLLIHTRRQTCHSKYPENSIELRGLYRGIKGCSHHQQQAVHGHKGLDRCHDAECWFVPGWWAQ